MRYSLRNIRFIGLASVIGMMTLMGTISADTIPGTFVGADRSNTEAVGGGEFRSFFNGAGLWQNRSGDSDGAPNGALDDLWALTGGNTGSSTTGTGGYQAGAGDTNIVTTISNLTPGAAYDVNFIWSGVWGNTEFPYSPSFTSGDISNQVADRDSGVFPFGSWLDEESNDTSLRVWSTAVGTANANVDGEIEVFVNLLPDGDGVSYGGNQAYNGVSFTQAVPEPSTIVMLLGLGGIGLVRRRR